MAQVVASLEAQQIDYAFTMGLSLIRKLQTVIPVMKFMKREKCDGIITVGGGSAHDCGKGIGIVATHDEDLTELAGIDTLTNPLPPIVAVNTTAWNGE